jgi:hypothetical protein
MGWPPVYQHGLIEPSLDPSQNSLDSIYKGVFTEMEQGSRARSNRFSFSCKRSWSCYKNKTCFSIWTINELNLSGQVTLTLLRRAKDENDFKYFRDWFLKKFYVWKIKKKFLFLVQLLKSIFYFRRTHKNACFMLYFIILKKWFEKRS